MKILIFSPIELPFTVGARYTGIERLCVEFARELVLRNQGVTLLAHKNTIIPRGVDLLPCEGYEDGREIHAEQRAFVRYQSDFYNFDIIHDWGHLHLIARYMSNMPTVNMLNNAPEHHKYEKAPYNIVTWSKWGVGQFKRFYNQEARYQESIMIDPSSYCLSDKPRNDRFLTIGRMSPEKGNLRAIRLCKELNLKLDVAGGRGSEVERGQPSTEYEKQVIKECTGDIRYLGEVSDEGKIELMQSCKALLYATDHAELTSHKVQEAMFCGAPAIVPSKGGMPEIVTQGVNGYLCRDDGDYIDAIRNVDKLNPLSIYGEFIKKYTPHTVIGGYIRLYEEVASGIRWR